VAACVQVGNTHKEWGQNCNNGSKNFIKFCGAACGPTKPACITFCITAPLATCGNFILCGGKIHTCITYFAFAAINAGCQRNGNYNVEKYSASANLDPFFSVTIVPLAGGAPEVNTQNAAVPVAAVLGILAIVMDRRRRSV